MPTTLTSPTLNPNVLSPAPLTTLLALINLFPQSSKPDQRRFHLGEETAEVMEVWLLYLVDEWMDGWMEGLEVVYGWGFSCWMEGGGYGMGFHDSQSP